MPDHLDPVVLAQWLAGELGPDERRVVDDWLAADSTRRSELQELREVWDRAGEVVAARSVAAHDAAAERARWSAIQRAIRDRSLAAALRTPARTIEFPLSRRPSRRRRQLVAAAATIALLVGGGTVWHIARQAIPAAREFVADVGAPRTVTLTDGSVVTLAAGSRLTFIDGRRPGSIRAATLDGQAFFSVAHDARHPFVVMAGELTTRVLGTEFDVRAYRDGELPSVVVRSGRVRVTASRSGTISEAVVTPGFEARVDSAGRVQVGAADLDRRLAWTTGRLEFVGAELGGVLREINRWYGLRLQLADSALARSHVTIVFDRARADSVVAALTRLVGPSALTSTSLPGSWR